MKTYPCGFFELRAFSSARMMGMKGKLWNAWKNDIDLLTNFAVELLKLEETCACSKWPALLQKSNLSKSETYEKFSCIVKNAFHVFLAY